eukprot:195112_1
MANELLKSIQGLQQVEAQYGPEFQKDHKAMYEKWLSLIPSYTRCVQLCLEMYTDYETQQNQIKELQTEINESKAHFHTLARHVANEKQKADDQKNEADAQIHEANKQIHEANAEIDKLNTDYQRLEITHNTLQHTHNAMCNEYSKEHKESAERLRRAATLADTKAQKYTSYLSSSHV